MTFLRASIVVATSFLTSPFCSKISSTTYAVKVMSFSSLSCAACFTVLCATANSPITVSASSYNSTNHCWRTFCCSLICFIPVYDCLLARMAFMRSTGGSVLMFSETFCAFSYASLNLASTAFISRSSIKFVQIFVLSSHSFAHSSCRVLILATAIIAVLSLCAFSSGGVPGVSHDSKS
jgi:hypothetical protein